MTNSIGRGSLVSGGPVEGVLRSVADIDEVFILLARADVESSLIVVDAASATAVVPLLPRVLGVICRSGGETSHIAIVCREFGLPCVMGADLPPADQIEGVRARISADGSIEELGI